MPINFNSILSAHGLDPHDVRLLRHQDPKSSRGRTPYELWIYDREAFHVYQTRQSLENCKKLDSKYWASFVADGFGATVFVGIYEILGRGLLEQDSPKPQLEGEFDLAGLFGVYQYRLSPVLSDLLERLVIDWGSGQRAWIQYATRQDKRVLELRPTGVEIPFPGYMYFMEPLSRLGGLPRSWRECLRSARGVYLLTCPKTKEQYVGSADGSDGFWGRWMEYVNSGHGGNRGLKSRNPSDYQVTILEVAGTAATHQDILEMEGLWQRKLKSHEMGLNQNLAKN